MRFQEARRLQKRGARTQLARFRCNTSTCPAFGKWSFGDNAKEYCCARCLLPAVKEVRP